MSFFVIAVIVLFFVIIFQIAKASEYVTVLKGEEKTMQETNRINGFLMLAFIILGLIGIWWCQKTLGPKILPVSASKEGVVIDRMIWITLAITGIVLILTQILLFWFAFKYQYKEGRKAFYYPHNNKLEALWTAVPAIVMTVLVAYGMIQWLKMTKPAPKNAFKVGVIGKQFAWFYVYPGADGQFGRRDINLVEENVNDIGLDFTDKYALDDILVKDTMYLVKDSVVDMTIQSRDVIHDVGLSHFRMKMDAVPDMPTKLKFTPSKTTAEMRKITGNPNFKFEISCDQMCGAGHYNMRGYINVVGSKQEFLNWVAQKPSLFSEIKKAEEDAKAKETTAQR
jgi:cytochrome c oxidase subunit II